jgi:hypothetical protein
LAFMPLHPNQHAYQAGKSVETALHQLFLQVGLELDQQETALGVFLDIQGVFNNTSYDSMCAALFKCGVDHTIVRWIRATLEGRLVAATLGRSSRGVWGLSRGCPQGGVLLPLLWYLVVDDLIARCNVGGVYTQGYMDGICLLAVGKFPNMVAGLIQWALHTVETWCNEVRLSVFPDNTGLVVSIRRRKLLGFFEPHLFVFTLCHPMSVKYLRVVLDSWLTWREHVKVKAIKAHNLLWACRRTFGVTWGLRLWLYVSIISPSITFASLVRWPGCQMASAKKRLSRIQRLACLGNTGAIRITPTGAMEALTGLPPLDLVIQGEAGSAAHHLWSPGCWSYLQPNRGHSSVLMWL